HSLVRGKDVVNQCRPHSLHLISCDAGSDSASADSHPALDLATRHALSQRHDVIRVVVFRSQIGRAEVPDFVPSLAQCFGQLFLQTKSGMIRCNPDTHQFGSPSLRHTSTASSTVTW